MEKVVITALFLMAALWFRFYQHAVLGIVVWEAVRDPIRKILDVAPLRLEIAGALLWVSLFARCTLFSKDKVTRLRSIAARVSTGCMVAFLIIGIVSGLHSGLSKAIISLGVLSYSFPMIGLVVGARLNWRPAEIISLFRVYIIVNVPLIMTAFAEAAGFSASFLGGIYMDWYRLQNGVHIPLPCGTYRSPDVLGLHAAHVVAFSFLLARLSSTSLSRRLFGTLTAIMIAVLILSARRKMQGLAAVFFLAYFSYALFARGYSVIALWKKLNHRWMLAGIVVMACIWPLAMKIPQLQFATTIIKDLPPRLLQAVYGAPKTTVSQSGFWGRGLGAATQGSYHVGVQPAGNWQEDGISRLFMEGGVPGALLVLVGATIPLLLIHNRLGFWNSSCRKRDGYELRNDQTRIIVSGLQSLLIANAAAFIISHQHISGDLTGSALIGFMAGTAIAATSNTERPDCHGQPC